MTRLLGVQIAGGFSYEARAFALLLRHSAGASASASFTARVLCQSGVGSEGVELAERFPADAAKLLGRSGGAELELGRGEDDPALRFAESATADTVGVAVVAIDFGWRPGVALRTPAERMRARLRFVTALPRALEMGRESAPDLVYSGQADWDVYAATYLARRLRLPQVIHLRRGGASLHRRPLAGRLRTAALVIADAATLAEEAMQRGAPAGRVAVLDGPEEVRDLPTGDARAERRYAVRRSVNVSREAVLVAGLAAPGAGGGPERALEAFARVRAEMKLRAYLLVVGAGPDEVETVEGEAWRLGVADCVRQAPPRGGPAAVLPATDAALDLSAGGASYGRALRSAAAAGVAVAGMAGHGAGDFIEDGVTGLLARPGDTDGLAANLTQLLTAPERAEAMGAAARQRMVRHHAPDQAGRDFVRLLGRVTVTDH